MVTYIPDAPLVSLIVPVYNAGASLRRCLDSISGQSYRNLEILLVDDGSQDGSAGICEDYARKDERFRFFRQEHRGVSAARNLALEHCTGEWICFADSDDALRPEMVERLVAAVSNGCWIALCGFTQDRDGSREDFLPAIPESGEDDARNCVRDLLLPMEPGYFYAVFLQGVLWNKMYHASLVKDLRFDESLHRYVDQPFNLAVLAKQPRITFVRECLYIYYVRRGSLCHPQAFDTEGNYLRSCLKMLDALPAGWTGERDALLRKLYHEMGLELLGVLPSAQGKGFIQLCKDIRSRTGADFYRAKGIPVREKSRFALVCLLPHSTRFIWHLLGN